MKILFYGAGVIGCVYATMLHEVGYDVTLMARGKRYHDLKEGNISIKDIQNSRQIRIRLPLIEQLDAADIYDLIIVTVRLDQVNSVIPVLSENASPVIMFMLNNPGGEDELMKALGNRNILLGFPGIGGIYKNDCFEFLRIKQQKTTIGTIDAKKSLLPEQVKMVFERGGFSVEVSDNMRAWLITHAIFVSCICAAIIRENGSSVQLADNKFSSKEMVKSIAEGFNACQSLGIPVVPKNLRIIFLIMPQWFCVWYWRREMRGPLGTLALAPHANVAKNEIRLLARKVLSIVRKGSIQTPNLDKLLTSFIKNE